MPGEIFRFNAASLTKAVGELEKLSHRLDQTGDLNEEIGRYLVRSVRNRIDVTKTAPDGTKWAENSELTQQLKGSDSILSDTRAMVDSIRVSDADSRSVTVSVNVPYAGYVQGGRSKTRGRFKSNKAVAPRPFMGLSDANKREIRRLLLKFFRTTTDSGSGSFGG